MKAILCLVLLGCVAGALCDQKKPPVQRQPEPPKKPLNLNWQAPEPKPLKDWHAQPASPHGGVNLGVEKRPTIYDNGNLKIQGVGGANRDFGGPSDGRWNAKVGGRAEYAWGRRN